jgi:hypothetical protein
MGRRRRKQSAPAARAETTATATKPEPTSKPAPPRMPPPPRRPAVGPPSRKARMEDAPKAPWSPFPLVELTILLGLILMALGIFNVADRRGTLLICGFALVLLSGLELSLREHFAGFRSHSSLLAGASALIVVLPLYFLVPIPQPILLGVGIIVFAVVFALLRAAFRRRSGGIGFRV